MVTTYRCNHFLVLACQEEFPSPPLRINAPYQLKVSWEKIFDWHSFVNHNWHISLSHDTTPAFPQKSSICLIWYANHYTCLKRSLFSIPKWTAWTLFRILSCRKVTDLLKFPIRAALDINISNLTNKFFLWYPDDSFFQLLRGLPWFMILALLEGLYQSIRVC